jgi:hypothetical protein
LLACFCSPYHQHSALHPIVEALQRRLQWPQESTPEEKLHTLEALLQTSGFAVEEALPLFAPLFSLPLPAPSAAIAHTPQQYKQQLFEVLLAWVLKETERQPVCRVLDTTWNVKLI